jgi:hypothetical protein
VHATRLQTVHIASSLLTVNATWLQTVHIASSLLTVYATWLQTVHVASSLLTVHATRLQTVHIASSLLTVHATRLQTVHIASSLLTVHATWLQTVHVASSLLTVHATRLQTVHVGYGPSLRSRPVSVKVVCCLNMPEDKDVSGKMCLWRTPTIKQVQSSYCFCRFTQVYTAERAVRNEPLNLALQVCIQCRIRLAKCRTRTCLTACSTVLPKQLTGPQLVNKFSAFYGTRRFITAFTTDLHLSLSWARSIQ